jgi:hypothetical protein
LLKELSLASLSEVTPRKRKLCEHIQNKENALCKLKKKYKEKKLKKLYNVESDSLMENLSCSLSLEVVGFLAKIFRNNRQKAKDRRWNFEDKVLAHSLLERSPKSYILLCTLLPHLSSRFLQSILNTVAFRIGINAYVFHALQHTAENIW